MTPRTIKKHLRLLREECIEGTDDVILKRVAYAMEMAVRRCTEKVVGWDSLADEARKEASLLAHELQLKQQ